MNTVKAVRADTLVEIAADAYVRGEDYRPRPPVMRETGRYVFGGSTFKFMEPPKDYFDQLFGRCITPAEAQLYHAVTDQLTKAIKTGQLKSYAWPLYIPNTPTEADILGSSIVKVADFKEWVHKYSPAARKDWVDLILAGIEPVGDPVQLPRQPEAPALQIMQKKQRGRPSRSPELQALYDDWKTHAVAAAKDLYSYNDTISRNRLAEWMGNPKNHDPKTGIYRALAGTTEANWYKVINMEELWPLLEAEGIPKPEKTSREKLF